MKNDLFTAILVAIIGVVVSYLICNTFYGEIPPYTFSTIDEVVSADYTEPDPAIFNFRAINPTVEVYVGDCDGSDDYEKCINESNGEGQIKEDIINEGQEDEDSKSSDKESSNDSSSSSSNKRNQ